MDRRTPATAIVLEPSGRDTRVAGHAGRGGTYRLEHVAALEAAFEDLDLSPREHRAAFGRRPPWVKRLLGQPDGGSPQLVRPSAHDHFGSLKALERDARGGDRGVSIGLTNIVGRAFTIGGRYPLAAGSRLRPRLTLDVAVAPTSLRDQFIDVELQGSYAIDTTLSVFAGLGVTARDVRWRTTEADGLAGVNLQLGRLRLRTAVRRVSPTNRFADFRVQYDFWR
jgi:hypothetical protein